MPLLLTLAATPGGVGKKGLGEVIEGQHQDLPRRSMTPAFTITLLLVARPLLCASAHSGCKPVPSAFYVPKTLIVRVFWSWGCLNH